MSDKALALFLEEMTAIDLGRARDEESAWFLKTRQLRLWIKQYGTEEE